jgi:uracil-DNA glycosylase
MPRTILVGEAWGRRESQFQHPVVGPSGRELSLELGISGFAPYMHVTCRSCKQVSDFIDPYCQHCRKHIWPNEFDLIAHWKRLREQHDIHITNVFNTQPPNNDLGNFFGTEPETQMPSWKASMKSGGSHLKSEHFHHIKRLWTEILDLKPTLVVAMGNAACWATIFQTKITTLRGTVTWSDHLNAKVLPTFHPAAVLRQMPMRVSVLADFQKAVRERTHREIKRQPRYFTIPDPTSSGIHEGYQWFEKPATAYAVDIETLKNQISIVGFARSEDDALVVPIRNQDFTNYWPTKDLEFAAWKLIIFGLRTNQPKIFQNGLFDISHLVRIGMIPNNCVYDTMLWHHAEYPELPKSLGFLGSIYADEVAWKILRTQGTLKRDE